jgi:hypothetical protein
MSIIKGRLDPYGPMVEAKVMQSPQRVAALKKAGRSFSPPLIVQGLLDTGASCSALDRRIIASLELEIRGTTAIHTPSTGAGFETRNQYDVTLVLGESQSGPLELTLPVIESDFASQGFFALIGRDVLRRCVFTYLGPADEYTLSF